MFFTKLVLLGTATVAVASGSFNAVKRDDGFPLSAIPSSCATACETYNDVFSTCPDNPSAEICGGVCNGTTLTELQSCISCVLVDGLGKTVTQYQVDLLNLAQQELATECVKQQYPAQYTGGFATPTTQVYPSAVEQATHVGASKSASPASNASTTAKISATGSAGAAVTSAATSNTTTSAARSLTASVGMVVVALAGVALAL